MSDFSFFLSSGWAHIIWSGFLCCELLFVLCMLIHLLSQSFGPRHVTQLLFKCVDNKNEPVLWLQSKKKSAVIQKKNGDKTTEIKLSKKEVEIIKRSAGFQVVVFFGCFGGNYWLTNIQRTNLSSLALASCVPIRFQASDHIHNFRQIGGIHRVLITEDGTFFS